MYGRKVLSAGVLFAVGTILIIGLIAGNIALAAPGDDTSEESGLIIDCSFGEGNDCGVEHLFELANNVMRLLLWLAITGAGILIFFKGAKLAINVFVKGGDQQARKEVQDALKAVLFGLMFILSAYLIVKAGFNIIGYDLGDPFKWNESDLPDAQYRQPGQQGTSGQPPADSNGGGNTGQPDDDPQPSGDFPKIKDSGIPHKTPSLNGCKGSECFVAQGLFGKLNSLRTATSVSWWVTESCPPTVTHRHTCHRTEHCDCVDINFRIANTNNSKHNPTQEEVRDFIRDMESVGLYAVYEIPNSGTYTNLRTAIPVQNINGGKVIHINVPKPHFSVYESRAVHDRR